jgi:hypothetical protein
MIRLTWRKANLFERPRLALVSESAWPANANPQSARPNRSGQHGSELQDLPVGGSPDTILEAVLLDLFAQVLAAQRHVVVASM